MILVGTSLWVGYLRHGDAERVGLLNRDEVLTHPLLKWAWPRYNVQVPPYATSITVRGTMAP